MTHNTILVAGLSLTGATALCQDINRSLVLVQLRKTRPEVAEILLTGM